MKKKKNLTYKFLTDTDLVLYKKNFIISALNLAFLAYASNNTVKYNKNYLLWPDGIFGKIILRTRKLSGSKLIKKLNLQSSIKHIFVLGNLDIIEKKFLKKKYKKKIFHIGLINGDIKKIIKNIDHTFDEENLYIITLPTPKQEQLAEYISTKIKNFKVICIGGGLSIAVNKIAPCPEIVSQVGLEWLWRLRTDTKRRLFRLIYTFSIYFFNRFITKNFKPKFLKV